MYKDDFALNNLQWLMCHKTKPNKTKTIIYTFTQTNIFIFVQLVSDSWNMVTVSHVRSLLKGGCSRYDIKIYMIVRLQFCRPRGV